MLYEVITVKSKGYKAYTVLTDAADAYFADVRTNESPDCVVMADAYTNFTFVNMNNAFRHIMNGAELIGAAKSRYFQDSDNALTIGTGSS